jgi:hypothetical protein
MEIENNNKTSQKVIMNNITFEGKNPSAFESAGMFLIEENEGKDMLRSQNICLR